MKRVLAAILLLLYPNSVFSIGGSRWGRAPSITSIGTTDTGSPTSFTVDSALVFGVSGDSFGAAFPGVSQTNGNLTVYVYCTAATGTPDSTTAYIYNTAQGAEDTDRPSAAGVVLSTSSVVDASGCSTAGWLTYSFTNVTLSDSTFYWFVLANTHATPASNNFAVQARGSIDSFTSVNTNFIRAGSNTDGWTTDGTAYGGNASVVIKYSGGEIWGNPYVTTAAHANNANFRGIRVTFDEDVKINCFVYNLAQTTINAIKIYQGSSEVFSYTTTPYDESETSLITFPAQTLTGGTAYDIVVGFATASTIGTIYTMGNSPPTDVQNVNTSIMYVDGAAAPLTATTTTFFSGTLCVENNPEIAGSGGGTRGYPFVE